MARGTSDARSLRLTKIHTLLVRDHDLRASYDTLWRYAHEELAWREEPATVRVDDPPPGQEAQIDFGEMGIIVDDETGRCRKLWVLIVTLVHSRYQFVWPTFRQTTEAVCEGHRFVEQTRLFTRPLEFPAAFFEKGDKQHP